MNICHFCKRENALEYEDKNGEIRDKTVLGYFIGKECIKARKKFSNKMRQDKMNSLKGKQVNISLKDLKLFDHWKLDHNKTALYLRSVK